MREVGIPGDRARQPFTHIQGDTQGALYLGLGLGRASSLQLAVSTQTDLCQGGGQGPAPGAVGKGSLRAWTLLPLGGFAPDKVGARISCC